MMTRNETATDFNLPIAIRLICIEHKPMMLLNSIELWDNIRVRLLWAIKWNQFVVMVIGMMSNVGMDFV